MEKTKTRSAKKITDTAKNVIGIKPDLNSAAGKKVSAKQSASREEISRRIQEKAHELYTRRGGRHGDDQADWYQAERIVRSEISRN